MKRHNILALLLIPTLLGSCSNFLSEYSQDMVVPQSVSDIEEVLLGETYMKSTEVAYGMNNGTCGFFNLLDDDINTVSVNSTEKLGSYDAYTYVVNAMFGYYAWQQDVRYNFERDSYNSDDGTWNDLYHRINVANILLNELEDVPHTTDSDLADYTRVKGEIHFLRAQFYFILANLYGKPYAPATCATDLCVPLKLTHYVEYDKDKDTQFERASVKDIYDQVVADLLQAEQLLKASPQKSGRTLHRATWQAASLLLSRVCLYMQNWTIAEEKAKAVIDDTQFSLLNLASFTADTPALTADNGEIIFSQGGNNLAPNRSASLAASVYGNPSEYCVTRQLYDLYGEDDVRRESFFGKNSRSDSISLKKYEREVKLNNISDALAMRKAEAYLNYAEACAMQQGKEQQANTALNTLRRQRIDGWQDASYEGQQLADEIMLERRRELCFEGQRWFDLRRYAVRERYPEGNDILHVFNEYTDNGVFVRAHYYLLRSTDKSWTFAIPRAVLEADKVPMTDNERDQREELEVVSVNSHPETK